MHAPFVFYSLQPYLPFAITFFFVCLFRVHVGRCPSPTLQGSGAFPSPSTLVPLLPSPASLFIYSLRGECPSPLSSGACHSLATATSLPVSKHTGRGGASLARLFIYSSVRECPFPTLQSSGCPTLFAPCLFFSFSCLFIIQFVFFSYFFSLGGVSLSRGLC
jgi:hypothetical protein